MYNTCIRCSSGLALFIIAYTPLCSDKYYLWVWGKGKLVIIIICYQFIITFNDNRSLVNTIGGGGGGGPGLDATDESMHAGPSFVVVKLLNKLLNTY